MKDIQRRVHVTKGHVNPYGQTLTDRQVERYNNVQDEINRWIDDGRNVPNWLLNYSHQILCGIK